MVARSQSDGHDVIYINGKWINEKTGEPVGDHDACAKCAKHTADVKLTAPSFIADGAMVVPVDYCIAPLIQMLNDYGVKTLGCCCGHGKGWGMVLIDPDQFSIHDAQPGAALILPERP